jgi:hypothetical protein
MRLLTLVGCVAVCGCAGGTSSRGQNGHSSFAYLALPGCADGCTLERFRLAAGGARQTIRVTVDAGWVLAGVSSSAPDVATFTLDGTSVHVTTGMPGSVNLELLDPAGTTFDRTTIGVNEVSKLDSTVGWSGAGPQVLAGVRVTSGEISKLDLENRVLLGAGAVQFTLGGGLAAAAQPMLPTAPENAIETLDFVGTTSGTLDASLRSAHLGYPVGVVAATDLTQVHLHQTALMIGEGGVPEAYVESTLSTDVGPVHGASCGWSLPDPSVQIRSDQPATHLGEPPTNVTIFRLTSVGTFTVSCSIGRINVGLPITRPN